MSCRAGTAPGTPAAASRANCAAAQARRSSSTSPSGAHTTARNRLTDWYRSGDRRPEPVDYASLVVLPALTDVEEEAAERSSTDRAVALIAELPPDQAEAVMLRVVVGMDVARVATIMGRTSGSVRVLCHRGLKRLEQRLLELETVETGAAGAGRTGRRTGAVVPAREGQRLHA